jgi:hypothetical protein
MKGEGSHRLASEFKKILITIDISRAERKSGGGAAWVASISEGSAALDRILGAGVALIVVWLLQVRSQRFRSQKRWDGVAFPKVSATLPDRSQSWVTDGRF